jgi:hypothetical protein
MSRKAEHGHVMRLVRFGQWRSKKKAASRKVATGLPSEKREDNGSRKHKSQGLGKTFPCRKCKIGFTKDEAKQARLKGFCLKCGNPLRTIRRSIVLEY